MITLKGLGRWSPTTIRQFLLNNPKVRTNDPHILQFKINQLTREGAARLQVITDFDRTLSCTHHDGRPVSTSYCVFEDEQHLDADYRRLAVELREKYYPIEMNPRLSIEQKLPHIIQWYAETFAIVLKASVNRSELPALVRRANLHLRSRTLRLIKLLASKSVPILVFSAGLGDIVCLSLEQQGALFENVTVLSNFVDYDSDGVPLKFKGPLLHMYNKGGNFPPAIDYFQSKRVKGRRNAILMGDSLGDCSMVDGAAGISPPPNGVSTVLKIGFLDHEIESRLPAFLGLYDIVLLDDQTMDVPYAILQQICA